MRLTEVHLSEIWMRLIWPSRFKLRLLNFLNMNIYINPPGYKSSTLSEVKWHHVKLTSWHTLEMVHLVLALKVVRKRKQPKRLIDWDTKCGAVEQKSCYWFGLFGWAGSRLETEPYTLHYTAVRYTVVHCTTLQYTGLLRCGREESWGFSVGHTCTSPPDGNHNQLGFKLLHNLN